MINSVFERSEKGNESEGGGRMQKIKRQEKEGERKYREKHVFELLHT